MYIRLTHVDGLSLQSISIMSKKTPYISKCIELPWGRYRTNVYTEMQSQSRHSWLYDLKMKSSQKSSLTVNFKIGWYSYGQKSKQMVYIIECVSISYAPFSFFTLYRDGFNKIWVSQVWATTNAPINTISHNRSDPVNITHRPPCLIARNVSRTIPACGWRNRGTQNATPCLSWTWTPNYMVSLEQRAAVLWINSSRLRNINFVWKKRRCRAVKTRAWSLKTHDWAIRLATCVVPTTGSIVGNGYVRTPRRGCLFHSTYRLIQRRCSKTTIGHLFRNPSIRPPRCLHTTRTTRWSEAPCLVCRINSITLSRTVNQWGPRIGINAIPGSIPGA